MTIEISKRLVLINSASAVLSRLLSVTVLVWLYQYLVNELETKEEFGVYAVVSNLILYLPLLIIAASGGLERFIAEAYSRGDLRRVTQITSTMAPIFLGIGLLVLGVGLLLSFNIEHLITIPADPPRLVGDAQLMFATMVVSVFLRISFMPFLVGVQVRQKHVWMHVVDLAGQVIGTAALFALLFGVSTRALWVPVSTLPQAVFGLAVGFVMSRRYLPALKFRWSEMRRDIVRPLMSFGGWTMIARIATIGRVTVSPMALNELPAPRDVAVTEVGTFKLGQVVDTKLLPLALVPLSTTLPMLTAMHATGQRERLQRAYLRLCRYVLWAFMFAAVPLIAYRDELWPIYLGHEGFEKYPTVGLVMTLLLLRSLVLFPQPALAQIVAALNLTRPMAIRVVLVEGATVAAVVFAVQVWNVDAVGAAVVMAVVAFVGQPWANWTLGLKLTGISFRTWTRGTLIPGVVPALATYPVCLGLRLLVVPDTWFELGASAAVACAVYLAVIVLFCLQPGERDDLGKVVSRLRRLLPGRARA